MDAERRIAALCPADEVVAPETIDLLGKLRRHLDAGLSDAERQEIVRHLVRIVVHPGEPTHGGRTRPRVVVEYRFPGVVETRTGTGSWPPRAGSAMHLEMESRGSRSIARDGLELLCPDRATDSFRFRNGHLTHFGMGI